MTSAIKICKPTLDQPINGRRNVNAACKTKDKSSFKTATGKSNLQITTSKSRVQLCNDKVHRGLNVARPVTQHIGKKDGKSDITDVTEPGRVNNFITAKRNITEQKLQAQYERDFNLVKTSAEMYRRRMLIMWMSLWTNVSTSRQKEIARLDTIFQTRKQVEFKLRSFLNWRQKVEERLCAKGNAFLVERHFVPWMSKAKDLVSKQRQVEERSVQIYFFREWCKADFKRTAQIVTAFAGTTERQQTNARAEVMRLWIIATNRYRRNILWEQLFDSILCDLVPVLAPTLCKDKVEMFKARRARANLENAM